MVVGQAEMSASHIACYPLVSHGEYADGTDRRMVGQSDGRPSHYAFRYTQPA